MKARNVYRHRIKAIRCAAFAMLWMSASQFRAICCCCVENVSNFLPYSTLLTLLSVSCNNSRPDNSNNIQPTHSTAQQKTVDDRERVGEEGTLTQQSSSEVRRGKTHSLHRKWFQLLGSVYLRTHTQNVSHTPSRMLSRPHQLDDRMEIFVLMSKSWIQWTFFFSLY